MKNLVPFSFTSRRLLLISSVAVTFLFCQAGGQTQAQSAPTKTQITRVQTGTFVAIDGLAITSVETAVNEGQGTEVVLIRDGNGTTRALPGKLALGKLILTRAWSGNADWYNWRNTVITGGNNSRRTVSLIYRPTSVTGSQFVFSACWPTKWVVSPFNKKANVAPIETMELVYENMQLK